MRLLVVELIELRVGQGKNGCRGMSSLYLKCSTLVWIYTVDSDSRRERM